MKVGVNVCWVLQSFWTLTLKSTAAPIEATSKTYTEPFSPSEGGPVQVGKKMALAVHWWNLGCLYMCVCVEREKKVGVRVERGVVEP